jgi:hypothetical protein
MDLDEIKELVSDAEASTSATREEASDMLVFGRISQWDDNVAADVQTEFRGTFDLIKSRRNRILSELWSNPIDITFKPKDGADEDAAETLTGMYRTDMLRSEEAIETALQDQVDCGFGAFRYVTEYESKFDDMNNYQRIHAEPINEANNVVYWDNNAKKKDKSDARWCMILTTFTTKGWERYAEECGIDYNAHKTPQSFKSPNNSDSWFWGAKKDEVKIGEFYHKTKKRSRVVIFEDPLGQTKAFYQTEIKNVLDELIESGFEKVGEKFVERWVVEKLIVSGSDVMKKQKIPGEHIPVVPIYGDWSRVEGREIWRGLYHDAQDPQRLHNFTMSYMADIVAKGPREKPIYYPGQIQGYEYMYAGSGADNNYPYLLQNEISQATGAPYPIGPVGKLTPPQLPPASQAMLEYTRRSVDDVTGASASVDAMMNPQVTEQQLQHVQSNQNMETFLYQNSFALAMKQAGRIYASMAAELYDVPRPAVVTQPDGTEAEVMVMEAVFDPETGKEVVLNDITQGTFEVYADLGPSFRSQKEQARTEMQGLFTALHGTPEGSIMLLTYLTLLEGPKTKHIREYARKRLILEGIMEPETEEEEAMVQQAAAQASEQQDPSMLIAMAEQAKAEAEQAVAQARMMDSQTRQFDAQVKQFDAETRRAKVELDAQKSNVDIQKEMEEIRGKQLDNASKVREAFMPRGMRMQ